MDVLAQEMVRYVRRQDVEQQRLLIGLKALVTLKGNVKNGEKGNQSQIKIEECQRIVEFSFRCKSFIRLPLFTLID